jgi:hypothetical protein
MSMVMVSTEAVMVISLEWRGSVGGIVSRLDVSNHAGSMWWRLTQVDRAACDAAENIPNKYRGVVRIDMQDYITGKTFARQFDLMSVEASPRLNEARRGLTKRSASSWWRVPVERRARSFIPTFRNPDA